MSQIPGHSDRKCPVEGFCWINRTLITYERTTPASVKFVNVSYTGSVLAPSSLFNYSLFL